MIDTLDLIDTYAAAGYAWLLKAILILRMQEFFFVATVLLAGTVWAVVRELPEATDGRADPVAGLIKYWLAALLGVFFLYVHVQAPLTYFAPTLSPTVARKLDPTTLPEPSGAILLPSYGAELLARDAVTVALRMSNPSSQNLIQVPAAQIAASKVIDSSLRSGDPQYNANLRVWREVIAPAYLDGATPVLRDSLAAQGLLDAFLNPFSDLHARSPSSEQAIKVVAAIKAAAPMPLATMLPAVQPMINERLGGAGGWSLSGPNVAVAMISPSTVEAMKALPAPPAEITSRKEADAAFALGRKTLRTDVYDDPRRQAPPDFFSLDELYTALGRSNDVIAAANVLRDPMATMWFGATCQRDQPLCVRALVDAQAAHAVEARAGKDNTAVRGIATSLGFIGTLAGRLVATVMEAIISSIMPASIGYAKAVVILLSPIAVLLMMWPGRFLLGVYLTVGAHAFIALWTMFYVIWDRFTGVQLNAVSGVQAVSGDLAPATLLASNIAQLLIVGGYFGLTALAFAIAMHATAALGRAAVGAAGAGFGRMASAGEGAVRSANKWGGSRWQATNQQVRSSARQAGGMSANATSNSAAGQFAMQARAQGRAQPASAGGLAPTAPAPRAVRVGGGVKTSPASRVTP